MPEYVAFVETRKNSEKWDKTGLKSEVFKMDYHSYHEEVQDVQDDVSPDEFSIEELREQFKVFRDPTYEQFL